MRIEKLPSGNYRIQKSINGKRYSITFGHNPTKREIDREIMKLYDMLENQKYMPNSSFNDCALKYIESKKNILSVSTIRGYESILRNTPDYFKKKNIKDIGQMEVQLAVNDYAASHSPTSTINLNVFINSVIKMYNPQIILNITLPQKLDKDNYIPTTDDVNRILEAFDGTMYYIPIKLACYGLRRSEVLALQYPDDFHGNLITINKAAVADSNNNLVTKSTKTTKSSRELYIDDDLLNRIKEQGYIYKGYPDSINHALQKMQKKLDIPKFNLHKLRHYFASEMSRIMPEADWLALGGWSSPRIAKSVYRHNRIDNDIAAKKKAAQALFNK